MKILISCPRGRTFDSFFDTANIRLAKQLGQVIWNTGAGNMTVDAVKKAIRDCDVYVTYWGSPRLDSELLQAAGSLKVLLHLGGSASQMLSRDIQDKEICVLSGERYYALSAAEGTLAYILSATRKISEYSNRIKYKNDWLHSWDTNSGIVGKTVGIVNYGSVSECLAELLIPFDAEVLMYDKMGIPDFNEGKQIFQRVTLCELCRRSDIVVVNVPKNNECYNMLDLDCMKHMKNGTLLIDISGGGVVKRNALFAMLLSGKISAVLDMKQQELSKEQSDFLSLNNLTVFPRISCPASDIRRVATRQLLRECADYINCGKEPRHRINPYSSLF